MKLATWIASVIASSSSSQFSRVSWQPSQEANFHTARVGLPVSAAASFWITHHSSLTDIQRASGR